MKYLLPVLAVSMLAAVLLAEDALKIPEGIRYKEASAKVNEEARKLLLAKFSAKAKDEDVLSLFETRLLTCGPGLWRDIKKDDALSKLDAGKAVFNLPVLGPDGSVVRIDKLEGKVFQTPDEVLAFWKAFKQRTDFTGLKIRKLNQEELKIFWAMIPFDITEPLFVLDSKKHKILVVFTSPEKLKILWIDDYQNLKMTEPKSSKKPDAGGGK